jgi:taurine dioxygenase
MSNAIPDNPSFAGTRRLLFHADGAYGKSVAPGTCLYALEVSPTSPPAAFVDSVWAYGNLSDDVKSRIEGLHGYSMFDISQALEDADPTRFRLGNHPGVEDRPDLKTGCSSSCHQTGHPG